jgi:hypothetical protein
MGRRLPKDKLGFSVPEPRVGMPVIDPEFPKENWEVRQHDGWPSAVYLERQPDGHLFHHTEDSWRYSWENGFLKGVPGWDSEE